MPRSELTDLIWVMKLVAATLLTFVISFKMLTSKTTSSFLLILIFFVTNAIPSFSFCLIIYLSTEIQNNPAKRPFRGYERLGKAVGAVLLFIGNIGLYYYKEISVDLILLFLCLAYFSLCALYFIEPYTNFGIMEFLLSGSMNMALSLLGIRHVGTWLVIFVCVFFIGLSYRLDLGIQPSQDHELIGRP